MQSGTSGGGASACRPTDVLDAAAAVAMQLFQHVIDSVTHEAPCAHVLRLLLHPDYILHVAESLQLGPQFRLRARIELLHSRDRHVGALDILQPFPSTVVNLAAAESERGAGRRLCAGRKALLESAPGTA